MKQNSTPSSNPLSGREQLINHLVEGVKDYAIFLLDPQGNVLSWNKGAERIKGFRQEEVLGKNFSIFYTKVDQATGKPQQALTEALQKGRFNDEAWRVRKNGSRFWASIVITPLYDTNGTLQGFTKITRDLTELRKSEEKFKWIIESAPDSIVIVNFEGKIQMVNAQTEKLFAYNRKELIGNEVEMLIPDRFVEKHYRHRQEYNRDPKTRAMGVGLELFGKRKNGDEFPVEVSLSPVEIANEGMLIFAAIRDITLQKQAEKEIRELNEQLDRRIAERTSELEIALANEKKALAQASRNQQKLLFLSKASEILSSSLDYTKTLSELAKHITPTLADWCVIHELQDDGAIKPVVISHTDPQKIKLGQEIYEKNIQDPAIFQNINKVLQTREPEFIPELSKDMDLNNFKLLRNININSLIRVPLIVREKEYGTLSLFMEDFRIFDQDDVIMAKEIARRATLSIENGRLYNEAQELNKELENRVTSRTAELQIINKELESFSYSVSHDLRAPLRSIDGFSNLILKKYGSTFNEEATDYFQRVMNATRQMGQLIDDLLKLARLNRVEMVVETTNLSEIAVSIAEEMKASQPERKMNIAIEPNIIAQADKNLIQVALHNLFENAFKYTRNNEVTQIEFGRILENNTNVYYIRDNGVGFDMKYVDKLFGAFQRLHSVKEFEGTGIGLATVQRIIHRHKGRIRAESETGKGAAFYFTLSDKE